MRCLLFIALFMSCLISGPDISQTTVIVYRDTSAIYGGADSKVITEATDGFKTGSSIGAMCKIRRVNNINFAIAGSFPTDMIEIATRAAKSEKGFYKATVKSANDFLSFFP